MLFHKMGKTYQTVKIDESLITPSRSATVNSKDNNLGTYENINYNAFEYRWSGAPRKFTKSIITMTIDQGAGMASNCVLQFYYIPPGITLPAIYVNFGTYTYTGGVTLTNYEIEKKASGDWVYADGIYIIHTTGLIEAGYARLQEVDLYEKR
jgi:hypothetical protein